MVSFQCDACADVVKKPKLDAHRCRASFTCLDCSQAFRFPTEWKGHTTCVSEAQKYQKSMYNPNPRSQYGQQPNTRYPNQYQRPIGTGTNSMPVNNMRTWGSNAPSPSQSDMEQKAQPNGKHPSASVEIQNSSKGKWKGEPTTTDIINTNQSAPTEVSQKRSKGHHKNLQSTKSDNVNASSDAREPPPIKSVDMEESHSNGVAKSEKRKKSKRERPAEDGEEAQSTPKRKKSSRPAEDPLASPDEPPEPNGTEECKEHRRAEKREQHKKEKQERKARKREKEAKEEDVAAKVKRPKVSKVDDLTDSTGDLSPKVTRSETDFPEKKRRRKHSKSVMVSE